MSSSVGPFDWTTSQNLTDPNGYTWTAAVSVTFDSVTTDATQDTPGHTSVEIPSMQGTVTVTNTTSGHTLPQVAGGTWKVIAEYAASSDACKVASTISSPSQTTWGKSPNACWLTLAVGSDPSDDQQILTSGSSSDISLGFSQTGAALGATAYTLISNLNESDAASFIESVNHPENEVLVGEDVGTLNAQGIPPTSGFPSSACVMYLFNLQDHGWAVATSQTPLTCPDTHQMTP